VNVDYIVEHFNVLQISLALKFLRLSLVFGLELHNSRCIEGIHLHHYLYGSSGIGNVDYIVEHFNVLQISLALRFLELSLDLYTIKIDASISSHFLVAF
jgi:hypothetical protein